MNSTSKYPELGSVEALARKSEITESDLAEVSKSLSSTQIPRAEAWSYLKHLLSSPEKVPTSTRLKSLLDQTGQDHGTISLATKVLDILATTRTMSSLAHEFQEMYETDHASDHHMEGDVWTHTLMVMEKLPEDADIVDKFAVLIHDVMKPATRAESDKTPGQYTYRMHEQQAATYIEQMASEHPELFSKEDIDLLHFIVVQHLRPHYIADMISSGKSADAHINGLIKDVMSSAAKTLSGVDLSGNLSAEQLNAKSKEISQALEGQEEALEARAKLILDKLIKLGKADNAGRIAPGNGRGEGYDQAKGIGMKAIEQQALAPYEKKYMDLLKSILEENGISPQIISGQEYGQKFKRAKELSEALAPLALARTGMPSSEVKKMVSSPDYINRVRQSIQDLMPKTASSMFDSIVRNFL